VTTPPPPGTPYHRLARTARHRWWRPVLGTVLLAVGLLTAICLLYGVMAAIGHLAGRSATPDAPPTLGPLADLAVGLVAIAVALPLTLLAVRWVQARPVGTISSVCGRLRWRWLGTCLLVAVPAVVVLLGGGIGLLALTGGDDEPAPAGTGWPGWLGFLGALAVLLVLVPFQAAAEEYVFRGWLLQGVGAFLRTPWPAILVQAVLFAAAHGWGTRWGFADLAIMATLTGWLTVRTGGLEAAVALHVVNNLIAFGGAAATGELAAEEAAADATWEIFAVSVLVHLGYTIVVLRLARRRGLATVSPEAVPPTGMATPPSAGAAGPPAPTGWPPAPAAGTWPVGAPPTALGTGPADRAHGTTAPDLPRTDGAEPTTGSGGRPSGPGEHVAEPVGETGPPGNRR